MGSVRTARWLRLLVWLAGGVGTVFLLLVIGVGLYTRTDHFRQLLRMQILAALQASVNGEVSLEQISGSLWEGLQLDGLSIRQNGRDVIASRQGTVEVHLLPQLVSFLRSSTVQIAGVTLNEPVVRLVQEPEAGWNIAQLLKTSSEEEEPQKPSTLNLHFPHLSIENGQISVRLADGKEFQLTAVSLKGALDLLPVGMRANVNTLSFALAGTGVPTLQWNSSLVYEDSDGRQRVSLQPVDLRTTLSHIQLSGTVDNLASPTLMLKAAIEKLAAADVGLFLSEPRLQQDLSGTIQATGLLSALKVDLALAAPNGRVTSAITANLSQTPPDAQGMLQLERFVIDKVLYLQDVAGEINGQVAFQGIALDTLRSELTAHVTNLLVSGRRIEDLKVTGILDKKQVILTAEAKGKVGYLYSQSQVSLRDPLTYETTLTVRNLDAKQVAGDTVSFAADVSLDAWIKGRGTKLEELDSAIKLTVLPSQLGALTLTQGQIEGTLRNGQLTLNKGILVANDTTVNAQGQIGGLRGAPNSTLSYNVQTKDLAPWFALAGMHGQGALNLSGTASGALTALSLEGKIALSDFRMDKNSLQTGTATYSFTNVGSPQIRGRVTTAIDNVQAGLRLRSVKADVSLSGLHPAEVQAEVTVQDEGARTHQVKTQAKYEPDFLDVRIQDLSLQLPSGTWRAPQQPHFVLRNRALSIENFSLQRAEQSVSASGTLTQEGPLHLQVQVNRFSLTELHPFLGDGPEVNGRVNADVKVQGTIASPEVAANLTTSALRVAGQTYAGLSAQSNYQNERLNLTLLLRQDEAHTLSVEGGIPLALRGTDAAPAPVLGEANLRIRSEGLSLAFLSLLHKQIQEVQGTASMDVNLHGPLAALVPSGSVRLQHGLVRVKALGQAFSDIDVEMQLAQNAVRLTQLTIRGGGGQLTGSGIVTLRHYTVTEVDLTFTADRFRLIDTREYRAAISGRLVSSGSLQEPRVRGALELVDTTARPNLSLLRSDPATLDSTIVVVQKGQELAVVTQRTSLAMKEETEASAEASSDLYSLLGLDVSVTIPHDTWVHLDEGSIELTGQVRARKDPWEELALSGALETVRGWYAFQRRKFRLEKGTIVFTGATPIDPNLDVVARYTLPDYQVDVVVGGTAKTPTVNFRSEPQLDQADILSLLLFGKPANALDKGQKTSLQSQALGTLAGSVAAELRQTLAESLGVDNLEFDVGERPGQGKIGVGKYVAPGVFVSTSQQLGGNDQGQDVSIEYQLGDDWQLKASTTSRGNNGVDILWHKRY